MPLPQKPAVDPNYPPTLRASVQGQQRIKEAIKRKGWKYHAEDNDSPLKAATKLLEPEQAANWEAQWQQGEQRYAISPASWVRFQTAKQRIEQPAFKVFCQILDLPWQEIADLDRSGQLIAGDLPDRKPFYGRVQSLQQLHQWIVQRHQRLVVVWGQPGIGKTALVREFIEQVKTQGVNEFEQLIWLTPESIGLGVFAESAQPLHPVAELFELLKKQKTLIVLDRWTEVLEINASQVEYANETYDAAKLLRKLARHKHTNSLILISDERPIVASDEADLIGLLKLKGLGKDCSPAEYAADRKILAAEGLQGSESELDEFLRRYDNPSILKSVADMIRVVHHGDISEALDSTSSIMLPSDFYPDVSEPLNRVWKTLSSAEKIVLYCLAIRRDPCSLNQLKLRVNHFGLRSGLTEILYPLMSSQSLVERDPDSGAYQLSSVWQKFATTKFVEQNSEEFIKAIKVGRPYYNELFLGHAFLTPDLQDDELERIQTRRIVLPILNRLTVALGHELKVYEGLEQLRYFLQEQGNAGPYGLQNLEVLLTNLNLEPIQQP